MSEKSSLKVNLLLTLISMISIVVLVICADRLAGRWIADPAPEGAIELIFPPGSEQTFRSSDFEYTAHINRLGLRDREIDPGAHDRFRILAIGDSYTYGWGVDIENAWVRLLEKDLAEKGVEVHVINAGKPGTAPPFFAEIAEKAIPLLQPDLVLVTMLQGDDIVGAEPAGDTESAEGLLDMVRKLFPNFVRFIRNARTAREIAKDMQPSSPPQKTSAEDNRRWTENTAKQMLAEMDETAKQRYAALDEEVRGAFEKGLLNPHMLNLAMNDPDYYKLPLNADDPWIRTRIENFTDHLRRIQQIAERYDAGVIVSTVPAGPYVNRVAWKNIQRIGYNATEEMLASDALDREVATACQTLEIPFCQVTEGFRERKDEDGLFFELDGHFAEKGHGLYARLLADQLFPEVNRLKQAE